MSTDTDQSVETTTESGAVEETEQADVVVNRSSEDYARALVDASTEAKKYRTTLKAKKDELADVKKQLNDMESAKLKDQGQWKELAEMRNEELTETKSQLTDAHTRYCGQVITSQVQAQAAAMGCIDLEALTSLAPVGDLAESVDENFNVKPDAIKQMLELVQKKRPYLFKKDAPVVKDGVPATPETGSNLRGRSMQDLAHALALQSRKEK